MGLYFFMFGFRPGFYYYFKGVRLYLRVRLYSRGYGINLETKLEAKTLYQLSLNYWPVTFQEIDTIEV